MPRAYRRLLRCLLCCVALTAFPLPSAHAQEIYFHFYDQSPRLNEGEITALAQDGTGFIWIGTLRGLVRFDGSNYRAWGRDRVDEQINKLIVGPGDELLAGTQDGVAWRRTADGLQPLIGPDNAQIGNLVAFDFDAQGNLWAALGKELWQRNAAQHWQRVERGIPKQETLRAVRAVGSDIIVITHESAWRLRGADAAQKVLDQPDLRRVAGGDGRLWFATRQRLWRVDERGAQEIVIPEKDIVDLRMRGTTLWLSAALPALVAFDADGSQHRIVQPPAGGKMLVDRENSLWIGSGTLVQFPEPDTRAWNVWGGAYKSREVEGKIWISAWGHRLARIDPGSGELTVEPTPIDGEVCALGEYGVWASDTRHLLRWRNPRFEPAADLPQPAELNSCVADRSGNLWFATDKVLLRLESGTTKPVPIHLDSDETADLLWLDEEDRLYFANKMRICRLRVGAENTAMLENCVAQGHGRTWLSHAHIGPQRDWLTAYEGVFEFDGSRLRLLPGNHRVDGGVIHYLSPAPDGEWWAAGPSALLRIRPCADCSEGWIVKETPGPWQGLPDYAGNHVIETGNGDLWIAGVGGKVFHVPHAVRKQVSLPAPIVPVRAEIDSVAHALSTAIELKPENHRLELEFAALSFRDRSLLWFRSRVDGDGEWSAPSRDPRLQFAAPTPGAYRVEMSASLDREHWTDPPAAVEFRVLPPWYLTAWARALFVLIALALLTLLYRLRVAALLRVQSERTRIAMDLHDEIGAGLSSIDMLAGAAARTRADSPEQQRIVQEIAQVAKLLGSGLRSLVWSLRSERIDLAGLGEQIADNARRLFPGDTPRLALRLPVNASAAPLPAQVRRHVLLFALEALHNVARHAGARNVSLSLDALGEHSLRLHIEDDGCGFDISREHSGTGLESMSRRAHAIGARFDIVSSAGAGTTVTLTCPQPRDTA